MSEKIYGSIPNIIQEDIEFVGDVVIGGDLTVNGSIGASTVTKTFADTGYILTSTDYTVFCDCSGGAVTINLPTAVGIGGRVYNIKKIDSSNNSMTIDANGAETIDGNLTIVSSDDSSFMIQSDNTSWRII